MNCNNSRDILESAALSNSTKNLQGPIESCAQSPIRQNVTLRGGINAGSFKKLAQFVAMQLCIRLCCEEKGCDVALMSGKNCYGVQCFSEELCTAVLAKKAPSSLMISHVTIKGEEGRCKIQRHFFFQSRVKYSMKWCRNTSLWNKSSHKTLQVTKNWKPTALVWYHESHKQKSVFFKDDASFGSRDSALNDGRCLVKYVWNFDEFLTNWSAPRQYYVITRDFVILSFDSYPAGEGVSHH